jgi:hypothetical protein
MSRIDWRRPSYATARTASGLSTMRCDICGSMIDAGELWCRGPRGHSGAHKKCRDNLIANGGELPKRAKGRPKNDATPAQPVKLIAEAS